jgi:hypothetical protein|tara:strand:- start:76 stop:318 length:243 start_codon:yes stop_codon:yes gene_type:complete
MDTAEELVSLYLIKENTQQLLYALEDLGYDNLEINEVDGGYGLFFEDVLLAVGLDDDPLEAIEKLLDRSADVFYHDIIEA